MKKLTLYLYLFLLICLPGCQNSETSKEPADQANPTPSSTAEMIVPPAEDTTLPSGRHNIYLVSGRDKKGFFVERSEFPKGYIGEPHVHNENLYVTIIKGSVYLAFGEKLDSTISIKPLGPGSFVVIPADKPHYEWFKESCTMQIEGIGPINTYYISKDKK